MVAQSVFQGLARDQLSGVTQARAACARRRAGKEETVLYVSDFDSGFDNWTDHWDGYRPWPPVSLTHRAAPFGGRSLMLSTSEETHVAGSVGNATSTFRRTTRPMLDDDATDEMRFMSFSALLSLGIGGFSGTWESFGLMIDTNRYDNTVNGRNFFKLTCQYRPDPEWTRWQIATPTEANAALRTTVPSSTALWHGDNDNKHNFGYVRLTIDRDANGGLGGYHEAQVGPHVLDLSTILVDGSRPTALEPLQDSGGTHISRFNGGDNAGFLLTRSSGVGGCQLFASGIVVSVSSEA